MGGKRKNSKRKKTETKAQREGQQTAQHQPLKKYRTMSIVIYIAAFIGTICLGLAGYLVSFGHHKTASIWVLFPALVSYALVFCLYLQTQTSDGTSSQADRIDTFNNPKTDLNPSLPSEQKTKSGEIVAKPGPVTLHVQPTVDGQRQISGFLRNADAFLKKNKYEAAIEECDKALRLQPNNREALRQKEKIKDIVGTLENPK